MIIAVVGHTGSGKSSVANHILLEYNTFQLKQYTTRPKRDENDNEYIFLSDEEFDKKNFSIVESYDVVWNGEDMEWRYAVESIPFDEVGSSIYLLVCNPSTVEKLKTMYGEDNILPLVVKAPYKVRMERYLSRELPENIESAKKEFNRRNSKDMPLFSSDAIKEMNAIIVDNPSNNDGTWEFLVKRLNATIPLVVGMKMLKPELKYDFD